LTLPGGLGNGPGIVLSLDLPFVASDHLKTERDLNVVRCCGVSEVEGNLLRLIDILGRCRRDLVLLVVVGSDLHTRNPQ
jgi:hypothetical protein